MKHTVENYQQSIRQFNNPPPSNSNPPNKLDLQELEPPPLCPSNQTTADDSNVSKSFSQMKEKDEYFDDFWVTDKCKVCFNLYGQKNDVPLYYHEIDGLLHEEILLFESKILKYNNERKQRFDELLVSQTLWFFVSKFSHSKRTKFWPLDLRKISLFLTKPIVNIIREAIAINLPTGSGHLYGSYATGLNMPYSDIDLVIEYGDDTASP